MSIAEQIAARIVNLCQDRGISVKELASISCIQEIKLNRIIQLKEDDPEIFVLLNISNAFNLTLADFFSGPEFGLAVARNHEE